MSSQLYILKENLMSLRFKKCRGKGRGATVRSRSFVFQLYLTTSTDPQLSFFLATAWLLNLILFTTLQPLNNQPFIDSKETSWKQLKRSFFLCFLILQVLSFLKMVLLLTKTHKRQCCLLMLVTCSQHWLEFRWTYSSGLQPHLEWTQSQM